MMHHHVALLTIAGFLAATAAAPGADLAPTDLEFFETKIRPVLVEHCYRCHSEEAEKAGKLKAGLRLDSRAGLLKGGTSGPALSAGKPADSLLLKALRHEDGLRMPPREKLPAAVIADFTAWIARGAPDPRTGTTVAVAARDPRSHWAFQPLRPITPPPAADPWARNPVDAFILAGQRAQGLTPSPSADRSTLIRRLYFDLIGLPPTPDELTRAETDAAPGWYAALVERLLASPHHGEHWGQHWLDVARYADSSGYSVDTDRPTAYHYRDFVIRALNEDLPFDRFVRFQVAGDQLAPNDPRVLVATGFCTAGPFNTNAPKEKDRYDELDDILATTGQAFLGLTLGCARCHDHKYDPVSQREYYRLAAAFTSSRRAERPLWTAADHAAAEEARLRKINDLPLDADERELLLAELDKQNPRQVELHRKYAALRARPSPPTAHALGDAESRGPGRGFFLERGNPERKKELVTTGFLAVLMRHPDGEQHWLTRAGQPHAIHPRVALADWLTDVEHGAGFLTARVIVNRLWQHHLGEGLVRTPNDFGTQGEPPSHPALLDWLAGQLIAEGWRLKPIHRLIVNSAAYRQATTFDAAKAKLDPDNRFLWRRRPLRLPAESVRDAILAIGGGLDRTPFGPAVQPLIPPEAILPAKFASWKNTSDDGPATWRRSIYLFRKRSVPIPLLQAFDAPDSNSSAGKRPQTTVVPQALTLMNDPTLRKHAGRFADRVLVQAGADQPAQVRLAYRIALARQPRPAELAAALAFLDHADTEALADFCHALILLNEFIYID
ncbi:MAG: PSD1 domain-containing protein [Planctomycetia bacterium]|nr:PSD1 domain-containing protein [Planctomycetia bacterium]